jgi:hypothetical protein
MAAVLEVFDKDGGRVEVLPALMARACVHVLPVAGAGISFTDELRIPLGASDATAVRAERLQTTLGEGPCLTATATSAAFRATGSMMAARWPMFYAELLRQTPYRTVTSVPLQSRQQKRFGALDLYSTDDDTGSAMALEQLCAEVGDPIAAILFDGPTSIDRPATDLPAWLAADSVTDRMKVWIAIGMLMEDGILTNSAALASLRGYAFRHDATLDELAAQVIAHQVTPHTILLA